MSNNYDLNENYSYLKKLQEILENIVPFLNDNIRFSKNVLHKMAILNFFKTNYGKV